MLQRRLISSGISVMIVALLQQACGGSDAVTPPATAAKLAVTTAPSASAAARATFPIQPAIQLQDANGNAAAVPGTVVTASISGGGGTLGGAATATTSSTGTATFMNLSIGGTIGARTLTFSATGLTSATATVAVVPGAAATVSANAGNGQSAAISSAVAITPSVKVTDADSNAVAGNAVTFAVATGGGSITSASATTSASGIAAVGTWVLGATSGANTLTATASGLPASPVTFSATATALPTLTSFAPTHAAYGFKTVVTGTNFTPASTVTINGIAASVTAATATSLTVAIPSAGSSGPIRVTTVEGSVTSSTPFTVDPYGPNIFINAGGTYSGNWQSLDANLAAVAVTTSAPVIIENCRISSVTDGVRAYNANVNVIVRNCTGDAVNPNVAGSKMGFFVVASNFSSVAVEHNLMTGFNTAAYVVNYPNAGDSRSPATVSETFSGQVVSFRYNIVRNVETRFSDGHGGFNTGNFGEGTSSGGSAFRTYFVRNAKIEVAWNEVVNQPYVSQTEDVINFPESRGLSGTPMDVHDNYIEGARPANAATYLTFSGCGFQTGDSPTKTDVGFIHVHDNQVVNFASCGLSISSGHNIEFDHNRAISARTLPDGTLMANSGRTPLQINDYYWDPTFTGAAVSDPYWHDNSMHDNVFSAVRRDGSLATAIFIQMGLTVTQSNNVDALGHLAVTADEQAEYVRWQQKVLANGVRLGPVIP